RLGDHQEGVMPSKITIYPLRRPPADNIIALVELSYQFRDLRRWVLQIGIQRDDGISVTTREACKDRCMLTVVAAQSDTVKARVLSRGCRYQFPRTIAAAVVDENHAPGAGQRSQIGSEMLKEHGEIGLFVVDRYYQVDFLRPSHLRDPLLIVRIASHTRVTSASLMRGNNGKEATRSEAHSVLGKSPRAWA